MKLKLQIQHKIESEASAHSRVQASWDWPNNGLNPHLNPEHLERLHPRGRLRMRRKSALNVGRFCGLLCLTGRTHGHELSFTSNFGGNTLDLASSSPKCRFRSCCSPAAYKRRELNDQVCLQMQGNPPPSELVWSGLEWLRMENGDLELSWLLPLKGRSEAPCSAGPSRGHINNSVEAPS